MRGLNIHLSKLKQPTTSIPVSDIIRPNFKVMRTFAEKKAMLVHYQQDNLSSGITINRDFQYPMSTCFKLHKRRTSGCFPSVDNGFSASPFKRSFEKAAVSVLRSEKRRLQGTKSHYPLPKLLPLCRSYAPVCPVKILYITYALCI